MFERSAKAIQFLVMIGFAITGPKFDVGKAKKDEDSKGPSLVYFKALTLVLMVSRLVLVFQYLQSLWFTRHYKKTILPMLMIASTYFVAAIIYLGLFWSFHLNGTGKNHSYIAWYIVAICETIVATAVSSVYRNISFKGTHLVQRMSLLTLIILGEGVIVVAKTCQKIVKAEGVLKFSGSTIGSIISAILILYFIYMLYFDWMEEEHFGTIWQQIWSFLHFPLHLALVLAVEGVAQSISWRVSPSPIHHNNHPSQPLTLPLLGRNHPLQRLRHPIRHLVQRPQHHQRPRLHLRLHLLGTLQHNLRHHLRSPHQLRLPRRHPRPHLRPSQHPERHGCHRQWHLRPRVGVAGDGVDIL